MPAMQFERGESKRHRRAADNGEDKPNEKALRALRSRAAARRFVVRSAPHTSPQSRMRPNLGALPRATPAALCPTFRAQFSWHVKVLPERIHFNHPIWSNPSRIGLKMERVPGAFSPPLCHPSLEPKLKDA